MKNKFLITFLVFLAATALLGILSIASNSLGDTGTKILSTCAIISFSSVLAMICSIFIEKKEYRVARVGGICMSLFSGFFAISCVIFEPRQDGFLGFAFALAAVAYVHCLGLYIPKLRDGFSWVQLLAVIINALFYGQILLALILGSGKIISMTLVGSNAVLVAFGTLAVPIVSKITGGNDRASENRELKLSLVAENQYRDELGRKYQVIELE